MNHDPEEAARRSAADRFRDEAHDALLDRQDRLADHTPAEDVEREWPSIQELAERQVRGDRR